MPRAFSALAMARNDVAPLAFIYSITGSTLAAKRSQLDRFGEAPNARRAPGVGSLFRS